MSKNVVNNSGFGFFSLLQVLFIGLKLTGYINWTWLWVMSPMWLPVVAVVGIALLFYIISAVVKGIF